MKNSLKLLGPLTFVCGILMISLSLARPAKAQPKTAAPGIWVSFNTQPSFPPGPDATVQDLVANLNKDGEADSVVYVPELHRLFAHYSR